MRPLLDPFSLGGWRGRCPALEEQRHSTDRADGRLSLHSRLTQQTPVGDGDPVGIARKIGKYSLGAGERRLGIDHEPLLPDRSEVTQEMVAVGETGLLIASRSPEKRLAAPVLCLPLPAITRPLPATRHRCWPVRHRLPATECVRRLSSSPTNHPPSLVATLHGLGMMPSAFPATRLTPIEWAHPSKMNVTSMVTRYSSIFPSFTLAFSSIT